MSRIFRSVVSAFISSAVLTATAVVPVLADNRRDDGDQPGQALSFQATVLWFVILPLAIYGIIALLVMGPGWVSTAKKSATNGFLDDPAGNSQQNKPEVAKLSYE